MLFPSVRFLVSYIRASVCTCSGCSVQCNPTPHTVACKVNLHLSGCKMPSGVSLKQVTVCALINNLKLLNTCSLYTHNQRKGTFRGH